MNLLGSIRKTACLSLLALVPLSGIAAEPVSISGIYPHLAMFNNEGECGTGAVVPWASNLWVITYGPHLPFGSSDKLYQITPDLRQVVRPESVGGTPANRLIHRETQQLLIGPYLVDGLGQVRVIKPTEMPGRLTGTARHPTDPRKVYYATMEEGLYEVDVQTLNVMGLIRDGNASKPGQVTMEHPASLNSQLPGYHGKGLYSGQGRLVYANNGEQGPAALVNPTIPSGALSEWRGPGDWQLVRRNQFTEVTGPGGIYGNDRTDTDPIWSIGWDARSLILMLLDRGQWHAYRLPKASHTYDGAHGWNTEWPRIRDIGVTNAPDLLMTMHGMFWKFPKTFSLTKSAGLLPRSTYLKVVGDFCRWDDRIVLGCDDTAKSEFLNKRKAKGEIAGPGQSQSNLQFVEPAQLDKLGPPLGRGAVWLNDDVKTGVPSEPFLFAGFAHRSLYLAHDTPVPVTFTIEVDAKGDNVWRELRKVETTPRGSAWLEFNTGEYGAWVRLRASRDCAKTTAFFHYRNPDKRKIEASEIFNGLAKAADADVTGGLVHARGADLRTLRFLAYKREGVVGGYELDANLALKRVEDPTGLAWLEKNLAIPTNVLSVDAASVVFVDERGQRWRLPKGDVAMDKPTTLGYERICREVCTERDLFNCHGTFYELPAENAGGFAKIRPITTHNRRINDYCSYRGLLVMSGVASKTSERNPHIIASDDGQAALWVGAVDDLWEFGKPRGTGGPWRETQVAANVPSDPYLITGYDRKHLTLSHNSKQAVVIRLEADFTGTGAWALYRELKVPAGKPAEFEFPASFGAYWIRVSASVNTVATAMLKYD